MSLALFNMQGSLLIYILHALILTSLFSNISSYVPRQNINTNAFNLEAQRKGPADNDFISNFFSRFLPTPEDIGLSRYDSNTRPENYPCTKTEWAELLQEDIASKDKDILLIRQLLAKTNLQFRPLQLLYDANRDGWKSQIFHSKLDKKGPAIVLAKTATGGVLGGYNPTGWVNLGEYRGSIAAFLFVFPNVKDLRARPIKLAKISGAGLAQLDDGSGPKFGSEGLTIALQQPRPKLVRSKLGLYYERLPDGGNSLLPDGRKDDELSELKVFAGVYQTGERIPYSDALPFSLN